MIIDPTEQTPGPQLGLLEQQALARLKKRRDLATQALAYVLVNVANWITWALTGAGLSLAGVGCAGVGCRPRGVRVGRAVPAADHRRRRRSRG